MRDCTRAAPLVLKVCVTPELVARNLDRFDRERRSLLTEVHLLDWTNGRETWPQPKPSMAAAFAAIAMPDCDQRFTANWAQDNERRAAAQHAERQRSRLLRAHDPGARGARK
jgi:hypothetical protein